jgi:hypothetical protein
VPSSTSPFTQPCPSTACIEYAHLLCVLLSFGQRCPSSVAVVMALINEQSQEGSSAVMHYRCMLSYNGNKSERWSIPDPECAQVCIPYTENQFWGIPDPESAQVCISYTENQFWGIPDPESAWSSLYSLMACGQGKASERPATQNSINPKQPRRGKPGPLVSLAGWKPGESRRV